MLNDIRIENFRGIREGELTGLKPLTVLVGANNSGKSTALESLFLAHDGWNSLLLRWLLKHRVWMGLAGLQYLFYDSSHDPNAALFMAGSDQGAVQKTILSQGIKITSVVAAASQEGVTEPMLQLNLEFSGPGNGIESAVMVAENGRVSTPFRLRETGNWRDRPAAFVGLEGLNEFGSLEDGFSAAVKVGEAAKRSIVELATLLRPQLKSLEILKDDGRFVLHLVDESKSSPLYFAGDGYKRLFHIATILAVHRESLVVLEEPEAFQHPRSLRELANLLWGGVGQGTQVILSTHSLELLNLLFTNTAQDLTKAAVIHVDLVDGRFGGRVIPGPEASDRLLEIGEDLRR